VPSLGLYRVPPMGEVRYIIPPEAEHIK